MKRDWQSESRRHARYGEDLGTREAILLVLAVCVILLVIIFTAHG